MAFVRPPVPLPTKGSDLNNDWTLPDIVNFNAEHNPDFTFCHQVRKNGAEERVLSITHLNLRNAVLRCQSWLMENVSAIGDFAHHHSVLTGSRRPLALFMESDVGLWIHVLALLGLDIPVLLLSARLGTGAAKHLLSKTNALGVVGSPRLLETLRDGQKPHQPVDGKPLYERQLLETFLDENNPPITAKGLTSVALINRSRKATSDAVILHSSGTTGMPKPIYHPHAYLLGFAAAQSFSSLESIPKLNCSTLPLYHGFGLVAPCLAMSIGMTLCLPVSNVTSAPAIIRLLEKSGAQSLMTVPSILEDISLLPITAWSTLLSSLKFIAFGGGPLKESVGQTLAKEKVPLLNHYGATEVGALAPIFSPGADKSYDYHYFRLRQDFNLSVRRVEGGTEEQPLFKLTANPFGWDGVFEVQDNLVCNPHYPNTDFNAIGRNDDLIVLSSGEKVLPNIMENFVTQSKLVKVAVVFGQNQFQVGLLVQPSYEVFSEDEEAYIDKIWPIVNEANGMVDQHAQVASKKAIALVPANTVVPRTDKGSIARKEVNSTFEHIFAQVFKDLENEDDPSSTALNMESLEESLKELVLTRLSWKVVPKNLDYESDLFELGMDSLQALQLRRFIISSVLHFNVDNTPRDLVYQNPTIHALAKVIRGDSASTFDDEIEQFCQQYVPTASIASSKNTSTSKRVVVITGATGGLGAYVLTQLANMDSVVRIICLNREKAGFTPEQQQADALKSKGINVSEFAWAKIDTIQTDTSKANLGLSARQYLELQCMATHIIHIAWPMDFNRRLHSFEGQFRTMKSMIELARTCHAERPALKPTLLFISSIAVVGQYPKLNNETIVPETAMADPRCADEFGYAKAKLVCERMIEGAANTFNDEINAKYVRVGQLTGAEGTGIWNPTEHFPSLVKSSKLIGALPDLQGTLSWIPVDHAASATIDILLGDSPQTVFHLENPIRQSWSQVLRTIASEIGLKDAGMFVPYPDWLSRVLSVSDDKIHANPAKKLASFFEGDFEHMSGGEIIMDTSETRKVSKSLRSEKAIGSGLIGRYIEEWRRMGFLE